MKKMKRDGVLLMTLVVVVFSLRAHAVESDFYLPPDAVDGSNSHSGIIRMFDALNGWNAAVKRYLDAVREDRNTEPPSSEEEALARLGKIKQRSRTLVDLARRYRALADGFKDVRTSSRPGHVVAAELKDLWARQLEGARVLLEVLAEQLDGEQRLEMSMLRYSIASLTQDAGEDESLHRMALQVEQELDKARSRLAVFRKVLRDDSSRIRMRLNRF